MSDRTYYLGGSQPLDPGVVIKGRGERFEGKWTEASSFWALERHRPEHCLPHRDSVFLVASVDDIDNAGGCTDWCVEVQPGDRLSRHDLNWSMEVSSLLRGGHGPDSDAVKAAAASYWNGVERGAGSVWEYLTEKAIVIGCSRPDADLSAIAP